MNDCVFCKIIKGELPGNFVYKDRELVAFRDINPKAPVHVLIVPVKHIESLREVEIGDEELLAKLMLKTKEIAQKMDIGDGFKVTINNGEKSGQLVFHLHLHLLGGWDKSPGWVV